MNLHELNEAIGAVLAGIGKAAGAGAGMMGTKMAIEKGSEMAKKRKLKKMAKKGLTPESKTLDQLLTRYEDELKTGITFAASDLKKSKKKGKNNSKKEKSACLQSAPPGTIST